MTELLYADDTLLISVNGKSVQRYLAAVSEAGGAYGLSLHWGKLQLLRARCSDTVARPDGTKIEANTEIVYLGTNVSDDGLISRELSRRLGHAHGDFRALRKMWGHTSLSWVLIL